MVPFISLGVMRRRMQRGIQWLRLFSPLFLRTKGHYALFLLAAGVRPVPPSTPRKIIPHPLPICQDAILHKYPRIFFPIFVQYSILQFAKFFAIINTESEREIKPPHKNKKVKKTLDKQNNLCYNKYRK